MKKLLIIIIAATIAALTILAFNGTINTQNIAYFGEGFIYFIATVALVYNLKTQLKNL